MIQVKRKIKYYKNRIRVGLSIFNGNEINWYSCLNEIKTIQINNYNKQDYDNNIIK